MLGKHSINGLYIPLTSFNFVTRSDSTQACLELEILLPQLPPQLGLQTYITNMGGRLLAEEECGSYREKCGGVRRDTERTAR